MINQFYDEYRFLSNFYESKPPMLFEGMLGTSVEHLFQAFKTTSEKERTEILLSKKPSIAKHLGRKCKAKNNWEEIKYSVMQDLVRIKFKINSDLREKLIATGDHELIEGNNWHDNTWGNCYCDQCKDIQGKNWLGKIFMDVRSKCKEE